MLREFTVPAIRAHSVYECVLFLAPFSSIFSVLLKHELPEIND